MADNEILEALLKSVAKWNQWRQKHKGAINPDLSGADLTSANLSRANLSGARLVKATLTGTNLTGANLTGAELSLADLTDATISGAGLSGVKLSYAKLIRAGLSGADLTDADIFGAWLYDADLTGANLTNAHLAAANLSHSDFSTADLSLADLSRSDLSGTRLCGADLTRTNFTGAILSRTKFDGSIVSYTVFDGNDLRGAEGLETVKHRGPSNISISAIYMSEGKIPEAFLRGCGLHESFITQIPALVGALQPIQFYSCFISYSGRDEDFAKRLHSRMREAELRVWFAPEDMKGGDKLYDQIDRAIQVHDRLLLVLSESSLQSKWVKLEIRRARQVELREGRRKLFPIRLVSYEALQEWACIDSSTGEDLAEEVRGYFIPDFSNWKNHDDLEQAFARLLADLKASARGGLVRTIINIVRTSSL